MNIQSLGDLAQSFALRRQNVQLKQQISQLTEELSSGQVSDLTQHLSGNFGHISDIEHDLVVLESYRLSTDEARFATSAIQIALEAIQTRAGALGASALTAGTSAGAIALPTVAAEGQGNLDSIISNLNTRLAGRSLFSGTEIDSVPLISSDALLTEVRTALVGATSAADIQTALDSFFNTPGGGFETLVYQGGTTSLSPYQLGEGESVSLDLRADDQTLRDVMKHTVMAAIVDDSTLTLNNGERLLLSREAGERLLTSQDQMVHIRANLGFAQSRIDQSATRISAEISSLGIARNDLLSVDAFETATELQNVQFQLETLYTLTARASRLSLVNFLS